MTTAPTTVAVAPRMLLSVSEVAAELGCGRDTVYRLMTSGALPSVTVGGRLRRVRRDDLCEYIDSLNTTWRAR